MENRNTETTERQPSDPENSLGPLKRIHYIWLFCGFIALIVPRALLIHNDPTDFPMDRNISAAFAISRLAKTTSPEGPGKKDQGQNIKAGEKATDEGLTQEDMPEFPFLPALARVLTAAGAPPIAAGRCVGLLAALLTGAGIFVLGRRAHSAAAGTAGLWLFALIPFSIYMGRSLLPDGMMTAALTWSLVAAGAPAGRRDWARTWGTAAGLAVAVLAKLPAVAFAPAAALLFVQRVGWRRREAWLKLAVVAGVVGLAAVAWYGLWNPVAGLRRLNAGTNGMLGQVRDLGGSRAAWVALLRLVLALSLPGVFLALVGLIFLQDRPDRTALTLWFALGVAFVGLTLGANTYWVYAAVPAGCLLGGMGAAELGRAFRGAPIYVGAVALALLGLCPSVGQVREYLTLHPEYGGLRGAVDRAVTRPGEIYYLGKLPNELMYFVGRKGTGAGAAITAEKVFGELKRKPYAAVVSNQVDASEAVERLFERLPIAAAKAGEYVIFDCAGAKPLGDTVTSSAPLPQAPLDLEGMLRIVEVSLEIEAGDKANAGAGPLSATVACRVTFEKGAKYAGPPNLALEFVHEPSGAAFAVEPSAGGLALSRWEAPLLQTPDFTDRPRKVMRYRFEIAGRLPAGRYTPRFKLLLDRGRPVVIGTARPAPQAAFTVEPPTRPARPPLKVEPGEAYWLDPIARTAVGWTGAQRGTALLSSRGMLRLCPALPAGKYRLVVRAAALPAGDTPREMWPILSVRQSAQGKASTWFAIKSEGARTYEVPFTWGGAQDFLQLTVGNPSIDLSAGRPFALYLGDAAKGNRSIAIESIEIEGDNHK